MESHMQKKDRVDIPKDISDEVIVAHNNTCCVCNTPNKTIHIHHIDENPANNDKNNLAVLCVDCHSKAHMKGGFGRQLNAGQITKYRDEWVEIVKQRKRNLVLPASAIEHTNIGCWEKIDFTNQCGIENAIAGLGLNQNNVISCPRLPIFEEAFKNVDTLHFVNIIGESGSGKSLTAFQIAYEFFKNGYAVYTYIGGDLLELTSSSPSLYIIDNAHLYQSVADTLKNKVNNDTKLICVYTDSANNIKDRGIRITAKQAVEVLYDYYKKNAQLIIPIVKKFNRKLGVDFGDIPYVNLLLSARMQNNPYYFNYVIRGAADYIKDKISDYKAEGFNEILTIIALYQILNADDYIVIEKINEQLHPKLIPDDFETKLVFNDKILVKNKNGYRFSHIRTAINFLNCYILHSFDNQTFANKLFWAFFDSNSYSLHGLLWLVNNLGSCVFKYKTNRQNLSLFTAAEIETIFDKLHERKTETFFLSIIERIEYLLKNRNIQDKIDEYIDIINSCQTIDLPGVGDFINLLINKGRDDDYIALKKIQENINYSRILKLFNDATSEELIYFVRFFDRLAFNFNGWHDKITKYLDIAGFTLKVNNIAIDYLFSAVSLGATFYCHDKTLVSIRDACVNKSFFYFKQNPIEAWLQIDYNTFSTFWGYDSFSDKIFKKSAYHKRIRSKFTEVMDSDILASQISTNIMYDWQWVANFIETIYRFDKSKYIQIIEKINLSELSKNLKGLWGTEQEFEFLRVFSYDSRAIKKLIAFCEADIAAISSYILFFSTEGLIYLHKKGKSFNIRHCRNDYVLINGLLKLVKKDTNLGVNLIVEAKEEIIKYIQANIYYYDDSDIKQKEDLHKALNRIKDDLASSTLSEAELNILLDIKSYNFIKQNYNQ